MSLGKKSCATTKASWKFQGGTGFFLRLVTTLFVGTTLASATLATQQRLESGQNRVQLIELYTSEGCSSCPSADKYISELLNDSGLWKTRIPLAFHVDYWDYIGWIDPFARAKHSSRQRKHHRFGNIRSIYTPGFVVDGREWTGFFNDSPWPVPQTDAPGNLQIIYDGDRVDVKFSSREERPASMQLQLAWLGVGLNSEVKRGENRGLKLGHNFVVLRWQSSLLNKDDGYHANVIFDSSGLPRADKYALVAWLEDSETGKPVQAVGGWIEL